MANLEVDYLGLTLKNPFVVSSCGITGTLKGVKQAAQAGAGGVVLKSLFEEQIDAEIGAQLHQEEYEIHPEAVDYINVLGKIHGPREYLELIKQAKQETDIPIIASVNCFSARWWAEFARQLEHAGADALELNIAIMPRDTKRDSKSLEEIHYQIVETVRREVTLPLTVKIGPYFTSLPRLVSGLAKAGAEGVVLFNRFYQLDVDPFAVRLVPGYQFSCNTEMYLPLRWVSILSGMKGLAGNSAGSSGPSKSAGSSGPSGNSAGSSGPSKSAGPASSSSAGHTLPAQAKHAKSFSFSASTGIHSGTDAAKMILAGANVVQIASVLHLKGPEYLPTMIKEFSAWLAKTDFASLREARGKLTQSEAFKPEALERYQYIKALNNAPGPV